MQSRMSKKDAKRYLANKLLNYRRMQEQCRDREDELINSTHSDLNSLYKSKNKISKTTEDIAIKIAEDKSLNYFRSWIEAIDEFLILLIDYPDELRIIKLRYIDNVYKEKDKEILRENQLKDLYPNYKSQYYNYKAKAIERFEKVCIKRHLIEIPY